MSWRRKIHAVISNPLYAGPDALNLLPTVQPGGVVHLGHVDQTKVIVPKDSSLTVLGASDEGIVDGDTFTISDGRGQDGDFRDGHEWHPRGSERAGNVLIFFQQSYTHDEIAEAIKEAIDQAVVFDYPVRNLGNGLIHLGGGDGRDLNNVPDGSRRHAVTYSAISPPMAEDQVSSPLPRVSRLPGSSI